MLLDFNFSVAFTSLLGLYVDKSVLIGTVNFYFVGNLHVWYIFSISTHNKVNEKCPII